MKSFRFIWAVRIAVLVFVASMAAYFYPILPDTVPVHWAMDGTPDGFSGKSVATFGFPAFILGLMVLCAFLPKLDPRAKKYEKFLPAWEFVQAAMFTFFAYAYFLMLYMPLHPEKNIGAYVVFGVGALFVLIGNSLGKIRSNFFIGIRTPWTLSDENVWNRTQRFSGKTFVVAGIASMAFPFLPLGWAVPVFFTAVLSVAVLPFLHSYRTYREFHKEKKGAE